MDQIEFKQNQLILRVKKSPLLGRILLYLITFLSIALPLGGFELIQFGNNKLTYVVDYHWFKDKVKEFDFENINYEVKPMGYEEDNKGVLVIRFDNDKLLETVTKIPISDLESLIIGLYNI